MVLGIGWVRQKNFFLLKKIFSRKPPPTTALNFIFLILTTFGVMDATTAATIIAGLDVLVGAIVSAAKQLWDKQQKAKKQKKTKKKEE